MTRQGTQLYADGQPYRFIGLNIFNANSMSNCWYTLGTGPDLDSSLTAIPGQSVFRAWFFQPEATLNGLRDWSAFDHTLAVAKAHGERVVATLADEWGSCEGGIYKNESWYQSGYRTAVAPGTTQPYRDWVAAMVSRYQNDPTIMAWQLMNEAEDQTAAFGSACSGTANATLLSWTTDMASLVKSIDANHLVSLGTIGTGQCGNGDYAALHAVSGIDLCEYHDYNAPTLAMPGDQWHGLQVRLNECAALNKPLFMGETGIAGVGGLGTRASDFQAKFTAQFSAGVVGELMWIWRTSSQGGSSLTDYHIGPGDPALQLLATNAAGLASLGGWLSAPAASP